MSGKSSGSSVLSLCHDRSGEGTPPAATHSRVTSVFSTTDSVPGVGWSVMVGELVCSITAERCNYSKYRGSGILFNIARDIRKIPGTVIILIAKFNVTTNQIL